MLIINIILIFNVLTQQNIFVLLIKLGFLNPKIQPMTTIRMRRVISEIITIQKNGHEVESSKFWNCYSSPLAQFFLVFPYLLMTPCCAERRSVLFILCGLKV